MTFNDLLSDNGLFCDGDWIEKKDQDVNGLVRLIQLADIGICEFKDKSNKYITEQTAQNLNCTYLKKGDILIARLPEPLGRACIFPYDGKFITAVDVAILRPANDKVNNQYIMYLINSPQFRKQIKKFESGTTRKRISRKNLDRIDFKIPDYQDQHRIVTRIEELFSQLDSGVETLKKTKEQLKVYRQAVLKEAFAFRLSDMIEIREIVDDIRIGPFGTMLHKSDYIDNGVPVINPQHIKNLSIVESNRITVSNDKAKELSAYRLKCNDIIMGRRGEMGRAAAITEREYGWICGTGSILFRLKPDYDAVFFAQILSSPDVIHYLEAKATGTTMKNLNEEIVKHIPVPNITKHEQQKITNMLDSKLSVCDSIEKTIDTALQEAEALRQSILKQAFEGGL